MRASSAWARSIPRPRSPRRSSMPLPRTRSAPACAATPDRGEPSGDRPAVAEDVQGLALLRPAGRGHPCHQRHRNRALGYRRQGCRQTDPRPSRRRPAQQLKAYASTLMPDTPDDAARVVEAQLAGRFQGDQAGLGAAWPESADLDVALVAAAREQAATISSS